MVTGPSVWRALCFLLLELIWTNILTYFWKCGYVTIPLPLAPWTHWTPAARCSYSMRIWQITQMHLWNSLKSFIVPISSSVHSPFATLAYKMVKTFMIHKGCCFKQLPVHSLPVIKESRMCLSLSVCAFTKYNQSVLSWFTSNSQTVGIADVGLSTWKHWYKFLQSH